MIVTLSYSEGSRLIRAEILRCTQNDKTADMRLKCPGSVRMTK